MIDMNRSIGINRNVFSVLLIVSAIFFFSCVREKTGKMSDPWPVSDSLGMKRNYNLYIPAVKKKDMPLLVYFHGVMSEGFRNKLVLKGYTGSPLRETGLIPFCSVNGILLLEVFPSYSYEFLDVEARGWSPLKDEIEGVERCIDMVISKKKTRKGNVFLAGISAGAVMAHHLANRRPDHYMAVLSHSQAYINETNGLLEPSMNDKKFGVVFCYTKGDYDNLKELCEKSFEIYKEKGYPAVLLRDLPPESHRWSESTNPRFWRLLVKLSQDQE